MMWWLEFFLVLTSLFCAGIVIGGFVNKYLKQTAVFRLAKSYLPFLLSVLIIRSFIFQPFQVISSSLAPTVAIGDFLAVNQSAYGLRLPLSNKKVLNTNTPQRGDIALFHYPKDPNLVYVKRVIGIPGDKIEYKDKVLRINGEKVNQVDDGVGFEDESEPLSSLMSQRIENLFGIKHKIFVDPSRIDESFEIVIPENKYFMMGDNRDDSEDSRSWGVLDDQYLIGRAYRVLISWDHQKHWFRFSRFGKKFQL